MASYLTLRSEAVTWVHVHGNTFTLIDVEVDPVEDQMSRPADIPRDFQGAAKYDRWLSDRPS